MGSMARIAHLLGTQIRQICWSRSLATESDQLSYAHGQSILGATSSRNMVSQDLCAGCCEPPPTFLSPAYPQWSILPILLVISMRQDLSGPSGKCPATLGKLDAHLELSFSHWRSCRPRGTLWRQQCASQLRWGWGIAVKVKPFVLPSNVVCFSQFL